jgi:hypothetical protein
VVHRADELHEGDHDDEGDHAGQDERDDLLETLVETHHLPQVAEFFQLVLLGANLHRLGFS